MSLDKISDLFSEINFTINVFLLSEVSAEGKLKRKFRKKVLNVTANSVSTTKHGADGEFLDFENLSEEELNQVGYNDSKITFHSKIKKTYEAKNGEFFTIKELINNICKFEKEDRLEGEGWMGGIDCHHIFFEGFHLKKNGCFEIAWGS